MLCWPPDYLLCIQCLVLYTPKYFSLPLIAWIQFLNSTFTYPNVLNFFTTFGWDLRKLLINIQFQIEIYKISLAITLKYTLLSYQLQPCKDFLKQMSNESVIDIVIIFQCIFHFFLLQLWCRTMKTKMIYRKSINQLVNLNTN